MPFRTLLLLSNSPQHIGLRRQKGGRPSLGINPGTSEIIRTTESVNLGWQFWWRSIFGDTHKLFWDTHLLKNIRQVKKYWFCLLRLCANSSITAIPEHFNAAQRYAYDGIITPNLLLFYNTNDIFHFDGRVFTVCGSSVEGFEFKSWAGQVHWRSIANCLTPLQHLRKYCITLALNVV